MVTMFLPEERMKTAPSTPLTMRSVAESASRSISTASPDALLTVTLSESIPVACGAKTLCPVRRSTASKSSPMGRSVISIYIATNWWR